MQKNGFCFPFKNVFFSFQNSSNEYEKLAVAYTGLLDSAGSPILLQYYSKKSKSIRIHEKNNLFLSSNL